MSLDKAIAHGKEHRRSYRERNRLRWRLVMAERIKEEMK